MWTTAETFSPYPEPVDTNRVRGWRGWQMSLCLHVGLLAALSQYQGPTGGRRPTVEPVIPVMILHTESPAEPQRQLDWENRLDNLRLSTENNESLPSDGPPPAAPESIAPAASAPVEEKSEPISADRELHLVIEPERPDSPPSAPASDPKPPADEPLPKADDEAALRSALE